MKALHLTTLASPRRFQSMEFHYDSELQSNSTTPFVSAPSSPGRGGGNSSNLNGGFYFSAPSSPSRSAAILSEFAKSTRAVVPFVWEDKPGVPKKTAAEDCGGGGEGAGGEFGGEASIVGGGADFEFSARFTLPDGGISADGLLSTADELFCNGQIRPLRLPPRLQPPPPSGFEFESGSFNLSTPQSPRSPRSPIKEGRRMIREALSGITKGGRDKDFDPFAAALREARKEEAGLRGRDRGGGGASRRRPRSLSPLRIFHWEEPPRRSDAEELFFSTELDKSAVAEDDEEVKSSNPSKPKSARRWSLKDFLFRSASEGRGQSHSKDRLWGLSIAPAKQSEKHRSSTPKNQSTKRHQEDSKGSAVKSNDGKKLEDMKSSSVINSSNGGSGSFSKSGRKMPISPHELHYTANRAQAEELRKKTFLPYRQGLLGCLGFSSKGYTAMNGLAKSLNTVS